MTTQAPRSITANGVTIGKIGDGDQATLQKLVGWSGWIAKGAAVAEFATADGGAALAVYAGARTVVVNCLVLADQVGVVAAAFSRTQEEQLTQVDWDSNGVVESEIAFMRPTSVVAERPRELEVSGYRRLLITLVASDPLIYSAVQQSAQAIVTVGGTAWPLPHPLPGTANIALGVASTMSAPNNGTAGSWPEFTVEGPDAGVLTGLALTLSDTGEVLYLPDLAAGQSMEVTTAPNRRLVLREGIDVTYSASGVWWTLPVGVGTVRITGGGSTDGATVTMRWRDASL